MDNKLRGQGVSHLEEKNYRPGERLTGAAEHILTVTNREQLTISGVTAVESFDDQEISLDTELGTLTIRGEELHIKQLDLDSGRFAVEGMVNSMIYSARPARGGRPGRNRGFFERLLR